MKKTIISLLLIAITTASLVGCDRMDRRTAGAVAGAGIGGIVGGAAGGTTGAVIGGVAGAGVGSALSR